jgi:hypothetical protein
VVAKTPARRAVEAIRSLRSIDRLAWKLRKLADDAYIENILRPKRGQSICLNPVSLNSERPISPYPDPIGTRQESEP